ncbi:MAG: hypothetical protein AAFO07_21880, partial [Bacteroidota bacterium]
MKKLPFLFILIMFLLAACNQEEDPPTPIEGPLVSEDIAFLQYKFNPLSETELKLSVYNLNWDFSKVSLLSQRDEELASASFIEERNINEAIIDFPFEENTTYDLLIETEEENDTVFRYRIEDYQHQFVQSFTYEKLIDFQNPADFDFSPSRRILYFSDYDISTCILKKMDVASGQITIIDEDFDDGTLIRAISEDEILYKSRNWEGRVLEGDGRFLIRLNIRTGEKQLVEEASYASFEFSRILNGYVLVPNPTFSASTHSLLNLESGARIPLDINQSYPWDRYFNQFYLDGQIFDFDQETFMTPITLPEGMTLEYYEETDPYSLAISTILDTDDNLLSKIQVYKDGILFFEDDYQLGRLINHPRIL